MYCRRVTPSFVAPPSRLFRIIRGPCEACSGSSRMAVLGFHERGCQVLHDEFFVAIPYPLRSGRLHRAHANIDPDSPKSLVQRSRLYHHLRVRGSALIQKYLTPQCHTSSPQPGRKNMPRSPVPKPGRSVQGTLASVCRRCAVISTPGTLVFVITSPFNQRARCNVGIGA